MKNFIGLLFLLMGVSVYGQTSKIRPYNECETVAFCSYESYDPSQYVESDNNWELLHTLRTPMSFKELKATGVPVTESQILLLQIGGLIEKENNVLKTIMPIFDKEQTKSIRTLSKTIAQSAYTMSENEWHAFLSELKKNNLAKNAYSLVFSYILDGKIWKKQLPWPDSLTNNATWKGAYWALYDKRQNGLSYGTNGLSKFDKIFYQTWSDSLSYWLGSKTIFKFIEEYGQYKKIVSADLIEKSKEWGLVNEQGEVIIPIINESSDSPIVKISDKIIAKLASCVNQHSADFMTKYQLTNENLAKVILYHEVMWDMMDILVSKKIITQPSILKGSTDAHKKDFGQITYILE